MSYYFEIEQHFLKAGHYLFIYLFSYVDLILVIPIADIPTHLPLKYLRDLILQYFEFDDLNLVHFAIGKLLSMNLTMKLLLLLLLLLYWTFVCQKILASLFPTSAFAAANGLFW